MTRAWLDKLLHTHDTPERTARAFALGVFFGFSPFLGLHTVMALLLAFTMRLNRVAVLIGVYSNLPWILPAYYTLATVGGAALIRVDIPPGLLGQLREAVTGAAWGEVRLLATMLAPLAWSFVVGSTLGAVALSLIAYRVSLAMIVARRRRLEQLKHTDK
ncbi:MAG: DUF2062 domain-containing protein [Vicinamibacterales bacterium]